MKNRKEKTDYAIIAVTHALDLLEQFGGVHDEFSLTELGKRLKLHKNNVFRLLATLEAHGYIEHSRLTANYRLGHKALTLSQTFIRQAGLLSRARPVLEQLAKECNETTLLAVLKHDSIVYLDMAETCHAVRIAPRVGSWLPAYCTAAGKVQLAYLPETSLENFLHAGMLRRFTPNTITDQEKLKHHLREIVRCGYALDREELDVDVRCVAAPIRDHSGRVAGAVSISGPAVRFCDERLKKVLIPLSLQAASDISACIGHRMQST